MASIRKKHNGKWEVQIRRKGFSTICKSFHMKADAQEWARYMEQRADRRSLPYDPKKLDAITLKALLERYKAEIIPRKRGEVEPVLLDIFMRREAKLCSMPLSGITVSHFCTYRDTLFLPMTKNGEARTVPLTQKAIRILRLLSIPKKMNGNIFNTTEQGFEMAWRRTLVRSGLKNFRFHDLRHEAVSRFFERGLSVPEVALISGHIENRFVRHIYLFCLRPEEGFPTTL